MARVFLPQSSVLSALMTFALDATFSLGETESSRSRKTRSALLAAAFSIIRSLLAGVDSSDRLNRMVLSFTKNVFSLSLTHDALHLFSWIILFPFIFKNGVHQRIPPAIFHPLSLAQIPLLAHPKLLHYSR